MNANIINIAQQQILVPAGLAATDLDKALGQMLGNGIDLADLYFEVSERESWSLEDGIVKEGGYSMSRGVGARAISGEKTGFAYSDDIRLPQLLQASCAARAIAHQGGLQTAYALQTQTVPALYEPLNPLASIEDTVKIKLLELADSSARQADPRIEQVFASLAASYEIVLIAASDGTLAADIRPLVRLSVNVIARHGKRREQGSFGGGGRCGYAFFTDSLIQQYSAEAVRQALVKLDAADAPAGVMPVVLGPGWPGVLLHEAVGHGLEADFNRKGTSAFSGRVGQRVASPLCTVVDDGTLPERRGSLSIDDEGMPAQRTVLIEQGVLKGYMQDKHNARLMSLPVTGNGRRESYAHLPMPRMTNTYMLPGEQAPQDIIASVKKGLYAVNFGGGQVDITSGKFVFSASEAYLIENGKLGRPVKGATLIGNGPEVLTQVSMVGHDLQLDTGIGVCGKNGQSVPVGVGQPTLKIDALTVGGTQA